MPLVAGVDSSTQSVKVVVRDAETGALVREGRATHPDGTEVQPDHWWSALEQASSGLLDGVEAMAVAAQQHGMVALDDAGEVVRPALLWNDTRSAQDAADLVAEWGGPQAWADAVGSVPVASFTISKVRWLARQEPELAARVARVLLPHDWLTWRLAGRPADATTDRGDVSGTGYWSPAAGDYRLDLLFYHLKLRCYVVIDLKMHKFTPEDAGKLNFYLSAVDSQLRHPDDQPTIGIVLCKTHDRVIAEYALRDISKPIGVAEWKTKLVHSLPETLKTSLPTIEQIENELQACTTTKRPIESDKP
jgi:hypothetical protein